MDGVKTPVCWDEKRIEDGHIERKLGWGKPGKINEPPKGIATRRKLSCS